MVYPGQRREESSHLIVVEVLIEGATIFVNLLQHEGDWPFLIQNDSDRRITLGQTVGNHEEGLPGYR